MDGILRIVQENDTCDLNLTQMFWEDYGHQGRFIVGSNPECDYIPPFQMDIPMTFRLLKDGQLEISYHDEAFIMEYDEDGMINECIINENEQLYILIFPKLRHEYLPEPFAVQRIRATIGRLDICDLVLPLNTVTKKHALIENIEGEYYIHDTNSANGVVVNHEYIEYQKLNDGDIISIFPYYFRFYEGVLYPVENTDKIFDLTSQLSENTKEWRKRNKLKNRKQLPTNMRLVLISVEKMQVLRLPVQPEGDFWFSHEEETGEDTHKIISITAMDGKWYAKSEEAYFINEYQQKIDAVELRPNDLWAIDGANDNYTLIVELDDEENGTYHKYEVRKNTELSIGRLAQNDICYDMHFVSKRHASLMYEGGIWSIHDEDSINGVYVNEMRVYDADLCIGDTIYIMGLRIIIGADFLAVNDMKAYVQLNTLKLKKMILSR